MKQSQAVSVIIPVYNEVRVIETSLGSLGGQTLKPKEIIVVDDGSTDKTEAVLSELINQNSYIRFFKQTHQGAGSARNLGVQKATGDILVFLDADMTFSRTFLDDLTAPIRQGMSRGTFSKLEYISNWHNRWARFWNYSVRQIYEPRAVPTDYPDTAPVFRAILKSEFSRVGGFEESRGYADDWSLCEKLGYRATATDARYYHQNPESLAEAFTQRRWAAKRQYRRGIVGVVTTICRSFPLWSPLTETVKLWKNRGRLPESGLFLWLTYSLYCLVLSTATVLGITEYLLLKRVSK